MSEAKFLSKDDEKAIIAAIEDAEMCSSGEIRVHIEDHCKADPLDRAALIFAKLKMHKTELRNGVLFYIAYKDHKLAILGDAGINSVVPENFWNDIKETMVPLFKEDKYVEGLCQGIKMAGEKLKAFFPYQNNDKNELPNEISY
ncbi:MAG TPA: TPM domain-containing protein [Bacteroidales bacterium]|nr:TPM domain-containing protein [Bacteroidales bacterium]